MDARLVWTLALVALNGGLLWPLLRRRPVIRAAGAAVGFSRLRDRFAAVALQGAGRTGARWTALACFVSSLSADPTGVWPTPLVRFSRRWIHTRYGHLRRPRAGDPSGAF